NVPVASLLPMRATAMPFIGKNRAGTQVTNAHHERSGPSQRKRDQRSRLYACCTCTATPYPLPWPASTSCLHAPCRRAAPQPRFGFGTTMIRFHNVSRTYDRGRTVAVADVNLHVQRGELLVLLGESGCGKTTT